ncbi:GNAT family N-acetyltransferase [Thetidibacter halocola]|uniref:GNAT family N-acetyltransferase n=1 Tax=Thetidibacter halocola TaxID=2827239 RepID=A0A8J7WCL1_9RHOB|nr:GNAT family N-acetyltransferase [Thetidibacter halocola]MBS0125092.1 GNAT family N-acetyltransferase [Thetidibacter halocola]
MDIHPARVDQFDQVVSLLTVAFVDDPVCRYLYPDLGQYLRHFPDYVRIYGTPGLHQGGTHLLDNAGATLWVPPDAHPDESALDDLLARSVADDAKPELFEVYAEFDRAHPKEPHWFLPLMGVDPVARGQGIGAALMAYGLDICDRDGTLAYLESTKPENIPFYERFGFTRDHVIDVGGHPPVTTMVRPPR